VERVELRETKHYNGDGWSRPKLLTDASGDSEWREWACVSEKE
jgi:hypothetical protein